ncbi:hypothetical protein [Streptomyces sp. NPDC046332]|uniref:hypothetical protein n=1 Tax=unclassified Streptomyces TaxID=2593676 RepID=UPI0033CFF35D
MNATLLFTLGALATARLTRLITRDRITQTPRNAILRRLPDGHLLAYLVMCDWCVSVYAGAAVAGSLAAWSGELWLTWVLAGLSFSHVTGWLASREGDA